jgi:micrococcal nuclease
MTRRRRRRRNPPPIPGSFFRRRSTAWLLAGIATLALAIVLGALSQRDDDGEADPGVSTPPRATPSPAATRELPDDPSLVTPSAIRPDPARLERAEVLDIIDGDTIDVRIDGREERVRYYGVDTAERGDDCYGEARDRNRSLAGETVLLLPDARERDRNGRLLRYVFTEDALSIEEQLIAEGLGRAWPEDGTYRDHLLALEDEVRAAGIGCLWQD